MALYDINGNQIDGTGVTDVRSLILSSDFKTYFPMYYENFASPLGKRHTQGKKLYIGGDSLHDYSGGNGFTTDGFVTRYNKYLGFSVITQNGYAGSTWTGTNVGGAIKRVTDLVADGTIYDVIILAWGTNSDASVGTVDDEASNTSTTTCGAMKWCIEQLRTAFPSSAIGVIIPPPSSNQGTSLDEKANAMIEVCEKMNVPYADMRNYISTSDLSDGTHLNTGGSKKYGCAEAKLILDICPYGEPLQ